MASNLYVLNMSDRPILVDVDGVKAYERSKRVIEKMFTTLTSDLNGFPSYPTVMAGLRRDTVYRFEIKTESGIEYKFSIGTVPRPSSLTEEITEAVNKAVASIKSTM